MGEILNPHKVELFDDEEPYDNDKVNANTRKFNNAIPLLITPGIPEGKTRKEFIGKVVTNTGAGGDNKNAANATDGTGFGGLWFGEKGIPTFEGVSYVSISEGGTIQEFAGLWVAQSYDAARIKYRGRRMNDINQFCNGYANVTLAVHIVGW